ncbi:MAG: tetratricopeptide repeat protein [Bacteroidota bacterium]
MNPNRQGRKPEVKKALPAESVLVQKESAGKIAKAMALICAIFGFVLYINTLGHNYTVDDDTVIAKNKIVTKGVTAIPEIFTTPYRKGFWDRQEAMYRPLSLVMFAVEWQVAPEQPFLGHLMNTLIYALTGFILFITLRKILPGYSVVIPFFATVLFIAHPLHTEVVASIKSRDELLAFLFVILSLNFLFSYVKKDGGKPGMIIISAFCFLLALLSKESAITFFAIFPLTLFFFTDLDFKKIMQYTAIFIIPMAVYFGMRAHALAAVTNQIEIQTINNSLVEAANGGSRFATAIAVLGKYIGLLLLPHPLVFDYSFHQIPNITFGDAGAIVSLLVLGGLTVYAFKTLKQKNIFSFCILYFLLTISLVSNIAFLIESVMAERFLYAASLGFCLALPVLFFKLIKKDPKKLNVYNRKTFFSATKPVSLIIFSMLILYSAKTISRSNDWKSNLILLKNDVKNSPNSARIRYALGAELLLKGAMKEKDPLKKNALLDESITQLSRGVEILPTYGEAFYDLGLAYNEKGLGQNAVSAFESAKQSKKWDEAEFYVSSGLAYGSAGRYEDAFKDFAHAISMSDTLKEAYSNWGNYLTELGRVNEAVEKLDKAITLDPEYVAAWYNKGNAIARAGDYNQALAIYQKVLSLDPDYSDAMMNIGNCYAAMKDIPKSIEWYEKVLAIDPGNVKASQNLALSKRNLGL